MDKTAQENTMTRSKTVALVLGAAFCVGLAQGQQVNTLFINLRDGSSAAVGALPPGVTLDSISPSSLTGSPHCPAGPWYEAHVTIDLKAGKKRVAHITVEYEGTPYSWTVNIGDSPTNDGDGGNAGGPEHSAEIQVQGQVVSVYSTSLAAGIVDQLLNEQKTLTDGTIKFTVSNQHVTIGQPADALDTTNSKLLFWIPDPAASPATDAYKIYAGFNRVVNDDTRNGCGARSVAIWTE
jgi:hypothetical protein